MLTKRKNHRGFEYLETASNNINSWPNWKKELAGLNQQSGTEKKKTTTSCSCESKNRE